MRSRLLGLLAERVRHSRELDTGVFMGPRPDPVVASRPESIQRRTVSSLTCSSWAASRIPYDVTPTCPIGSASTDRSRQI